MTAKETVRWMKEKNIYKHWILPELGCNDIIGGKNCYANRPVGNSPELMCLDNSLNKDVCECFRRHVSCTQKLDRSDPRRFSNATPKEIDQSIFRLVTPDESGVVPTSCRIIQDIDRVDYSLHEIMKAKGAVVPGLAERSGHRKNNLPQKRQHNSHQAITYDIHLEALDVAEDTKDEVIMLFNKPLEDEE